MKKWRKKDIDFANKSAHNLIADLYDEEIYPVFYIYQSNRMIEVKDWYGTSIGTTKRPTLGGDLARAYFPDGYEFNIDIGRYIALCKLVGRELPDFWVEE